MQGGCRVGSWDRGGHCWENQGHLNQSPESTGESNAGFLAVADAPLLTERKPGRGSLC